MFIIARMAFRNLIREKRRTILLGIGFSFSLMALVADHAYYEGLSDIILNRMVADEMGHLILTATEKTPSRLIPGIIRDRDEIVNIITTTLDDIKAVSEFVISPGVRIIGKNNRSVTALRGVGDGEYFDEILSRLEVIDGNIDDLRNKTVENPLVLYSAMARKLNVTVGDSVKIILPTIYMGFKSAQLNIVAIVESRNPFFDRQGLVLLQDQKALMGFKPYETLALTVVFNHLKNPAVSQVNADLLKKSLTPKPAAIYGSFQNRENTTQGTMLAFQSSEQAVDLYTSHLKQVNGDIGKFTQNKGKILMGRSLANRLNLEMGETVTFGFETTFKGPSPLYRYEVAAIITGDNGIYDNMAFLNELDLYDIYYVNQPRNIREYADAFLPGEKSSIYPAIAPDFRWVDTGGSVMEMADNLLQFVHTGEEDWNGKILGIVTMQQIAKIALQFEGTLKLISTIVFLILLMVLLFGLTNTLRMTIIERTREIGTMRAVGMQRGQVRLLIVLEAVFLCVFASIIGIVLGIVQIKLLSIFITFKPDNPLAILTQNGHLHFVLHFWTIFKDFLLIVGITLITVYFPANRAANMNVAEALAYYE